MALPLRGGETKALRTCAGHRRMIGLDPPSAICCAVWADY